MSLGNLDFTSVSFLDRASRFPSELIPGKNYPRSQFNLVLRHCITGLFPDMNFLYNVENALHYPSNRARETCGNRGRQLAKQLVQDQDAHRRRVVHDQMREWRRRQRIEKESAFIVLTELP
ncbi:hypothetical protein L915_06552 [Phytophthora nicotianae]|uniref:Uncharacterized protein n=1 Tax=Phytophthora nicotianae TaxID=4792 RepID=W2H2I0_PHYNI|nr:hypothetical protein L915_06552 [Phytophthora nicotianae]